MESQNARLVVLTKIQVIQCHYSSFCCVTKSRSRELSTQLYCL